MVPRYIRVTVSSSEATCGAERVDGLCDTLKNLPAKICEWAQFQSARSVGVIFLATTLSRPKQYLKNVKLE